MGRTIGDNVQTDYPPMVGLRVKGNYVKGKVIDKTLTKAGNPALTLELIDLEGSTSKSVSKGVYEEVEVAVGDKVQIVGSVKQLREKLPLVEIGETVTVTFLEKIAIGGGKTVNQFLVEVE